MMGFRIDENGERSIELLMCKWVLRSWDAIMMDEFTVMDDVFMCS
jgi:hypothetical protein